ncbi:MAG: response regulator [Nitrospirae bacterium]|nr:MAG: response regulator [Nitrospirota bacterium]
MAWKLLLADDSITIQKVVELVLAEEDFEIKSVSNGEDALNLLSSFVPDIVLADIEMPKLNGYQLCDKIRQNPATASIPVILLAGAFEPIDAELAQKVGADDSVIKPFESQELISKINSILTMRSSDEAEAIAVEEMAEEEMEIAEDIETAIQPEAEEAELAEVSAEPMEEAAEEDLWAMEDASEIADEFAVEALEEEVPAAEMIPEVIPEARPEMVVEEPKPAPVFAARPAAPAAERKTVALQDIEAPSKEEVLALINKKVDEKIAGLFASLDLKEALVAAAAPVMKDTIEKILWEVAPELVERVTKEAMKGAFGSISKEVEKVLWETVPELASSLITKEIEKIKAEF